MSSTETLALVVALLSIAAVVALIVITLSRRLHRSPELRAANQCPEDLDLPFLAVEGEYISTTLAGDPLTRVTDFGLGFKSLGALDIHPKGLVIVRTGDTDFFIPSHDILGVERGDGIIGKFVEKKGLVTVSWLLGTDEVVTGFRARYAADTQRFVDAAREFYSHIAQYREPAAGGFVQRQEIDEHE